MKCLIGLIVLYITGTNGNPAGRISGGATADIAQHPYSASLLSNLGSGTFTHVCGGTIISTTAILSAASCFVTNNQVHGIASWRARVGSTNSNTQGLTYLIRRITPHPNFVSATLANDIAVLRTTLAMTFGPTVQRAYIAGSFYSLDTNQAVVAIGWGATSTTAGLSVQLQEVQIWVINQQTCTNRLNEVGFVVPENTVCAGWLDVGIRGQCEGDVGSPLLHNGVVVGVLSRTEGCGGGRYPSVNTRVSPYSRWIEATAVAV